MEQQAEQIKRTAPDVDPARGNLVKRWCKRVLAAKKHHEPAYKRMRRNMQYARLGYDPAGWDDTKYAANIIQRHINQSVASLYAKNPRAVAKRRPRLNYKLWDGKQTSLTAALKSVQEAMMLNEPPDPNVLALIEDVRTAQKQIAMLDRLAKTLEYMFHYYLGEQQPKFKKSAKQLVRRTKVCGVGYIELGFQRELEARPEVTAQINDIANQIAAVERIAADLMDGEIDNDSPEVEQLRQIEKDLREQEMMISREGLVYDFPKATEIIIDPRCTQVQGFVGAGWIARELSMTPEEVRSVYKIDVGKTYAGYSPENKSRFETFLDGDNEGGKSKRLVTVWKIWDKETGQELHIADGYPDFLREPAKPDVFLERFWPVFELTFNDIEDEDEIYPPSDVHLTIPMQDEYNRSRQGLREHRRANRPKYGVARGRLDDEDKEKLASHPDNAILELNALKGDESVDKLLQPIKGAPIDPAMYDTSSVFEDVLRTVGSQEANLGGVAGGTATESSIAESSRMSSNSSNADDLDELLSELADASGQVMLLELDKETVLAIAGPGAVWPEFSREEIVKQVYLEIVAGSSGRPNKAAELANLERAAPTLLQIPGVSPDWFARKVIERLDDALDVDEAIVSGMPSIIAMNAQSQLSTGNPADDPAQQGDDGARNAPLGGREEPGGQPAYPHGALTVA